MNGTAPAQQSSLKAWRVKAQDSLRTRGAGGTLRVAFSMLREACRRRLTWNPYNPLRQYLDRRYDARFGVDTAGIDPIDEVQSFDANWYSPVPRPTLLRILRRMQLDYSQFTFIDLGCGKGKALLVAAELPFRRIIGVELVARLADIARQNLDKLQLSMKVPPYEVLAANACEYCLPEEPLILFLYDPFAREVLRPVLENFRVSLEKAPRQAYVIYLDPSHKQVFDECKFLTPLTATGQLCIYTSDPRERAVAETR